MMFVGGLHLLLVDYFSAILYQYFLFRYLSIFQKLLHFLLWCVVPHYIILWFLCLCELAE